MSTSCFRATYAYFLFPGSCAFIRLRIMVKEIHVQGLEAYKKAVDENKGKTIFALFSGSTDADGKSWCPDCVTGKSDLNSCWRRLYNCALSLLTNNNWSHQFLERTKYKNVTTSVVFFIIIKAGNNTRKLIFDIVWVDCLVPKYQLLFQLTQL